MCSIYREVVVILYWSPEDAAYAAGLVDGEGWLGISCKQPGSKGATNPAFLPNVTITMADRQPLDFLTSKWGGRIINKKPHGSNKREMYYMWYLRLNELKEFLLAIRPYLKIKGSQADLLLSYITEAPRKQWSRSTPPEVVELRQNYYNRMRALNSRA